MAGDWLKIEKDTPDKVKVLVLAERLGVSQGDAFLACFRVWAWADSFTDNGIVPHITTASIDRLTHLPGFAQALIDVGWLHVRSGALELPKFNQHMGQAGKVKALTSMRAKLYKVKANDCQVGNGQVTLGALPPSPPPLKEREKPPPIPPPKEKENQPPPTPERAAFDEFWKAYPRKTAKQAAVKAWDKLKPAAELLQTLLAALERHKRTEQWRRGVVPHPATWLNGRRWEDEVFVANGQQHAETVEQRVARREREKAERLRREQEELAKDPVQEEQLAAVRRMAGKAGRNVT